MNKKVLMTVISLMVCVSCLVMALAVTGCAGREITPDEAVTEEESDGGGASDGQGKQAGAALSEGDEAPDFTAELADGGTFTLSGHRDEIVLVNFWATWCGPCVGEMPAFEELKNEGIEGFTMVAVNCMEPKTEVDAFISRSGYTFNVAYDEDGSIEQYYPTSGIPYSLFIKDGVIEKIYLGAPRDAYGEYRAAIEELQA